MSDTRPPFQVPPPGDDDASGADTGGSAGGQGRTPAPWPMPEHAQPSPAPRTPWPEQSGHGVPAPAPAWEDRQDDRDTDDEAGEVTAWGFPAYRDPQPLPPPAAPGAQAPYPTPGAHGPYPPTAYGTSPAFGTSAPYPAPPSSAARETRTPYPDTQASHPYERAPHPGTPHPDPRAPYPDTQTAYPGTSPPDTRPPHPDARTRYQDTQEATSARRPDTAPRTTPANRPLDPLDPAWSPTPPVQRPERDWSQIPPVPPAPPVQGPGQDWSQIPPAQGPGQDWSQVSPAPPAQMPERDWAAEPGFPQRLPEHGTGRPLEQGWSPEQGIPRPPEQGWSPEHGVPQAPGQPPSQTPGQSAAHPAPHTPAWVAGVPQVQPQEAPPAPERPFSYWENSSRLPEPEAERRALLEQQPFPEPQRDSPEKPSAPPARKKREPYLDNVKFVLIALVVTGHSLVPTLAAHSAKSAYLFIYTFHMPAFVLISGYLGRNFWNSNAKINKLVDTLLVPYAFVEIGYALLRYSLGQKWTLTIIDPAWLNWYLVALVLWRISTPIWTRMRQPLLVAVTIYMVAGFSEISGDFSLDRFFGLLPFYVLGLLLKPEHFDLLKPLWVRIAAGVTVVAGMGIAVLIAPRVGLDPVYFRYSFKHMHLNWWMGLTVRGAVLVAALVLTVAVLALVPRRETWFSELGTRTLYAYLLHGVLVLIAKDQGWLSVSWLHGPLGVLALASNALLLAFVLCLPQARTLFRWLLEPRLVWLYRRPSDSPAHRKRSAQVPR
ncbi:acyltransferase family protein [Streptosporangium sp. NPDC006007]|uniref:acyltransferase family protein n=1 Tax=Streptosporangium sp. NPDC006007 TaxID=3154575 RepID=UPI0033B2EB63